ncbi:MAG: YbaK/EbsC family protein, partial [bacterium]|nr:YbaK/EbsC family protein [bacterium]
EIGAIPPFGNAMNLITYVDELVFENEEIAFNVGAHTKSVLMKSKDFKSLVNPIIASFSL